jgi:hypothetical protein
MSKPEVASKTSRQTEAEAVKVLALTRAGKTIREKVREDSKTTIDAAKGYLVDSQTIAEIDPEAHLRFDDHRNKALTLVGQGDIDAAIKMCERARDARDGIVLVKISLPGQVPVIIRDARGQTKDPDLTRGVEAYEMQYLNLIGAAMAVIDAEVTDDKKEGAKQALLLSAREFMGSFQGLAEKAEIIDTKGNLPKDVDKRIGKERQLAKMLDGMVEKGIVGILAEAGIQSPSDAISVYKDFQGLGNQPHNVVTLAKVTEEATLGNKLQAGLSRIPFLGINAPKPPQERVVMEAEVAQKGLTTEQKNEYAKIFDDDVSKRPEWFTALPERQQNLVRQHAPAIIGGEVVMATQLWQLIGMKNPFTKFTGVADAKGTNLEVVHISKHSGTLASISESTNIDERERITELNFKQAIEGVEQDATLSIVDFNTAGALAKSHDGTITKQMDNVSRRMNDEKKGATSRATTPFNLGRLFGSSSQSSGAQDVLKKISEALEKGLSTVVADDPAKAAALKSLQAHLELTNIKGLFIGAKETAKEVGSIDPAKAIKILFGDPANEDSKKTVELLETALALKESVIKMSSASRFWSKGNASQDVSGAMARISFLSMKKGNEGQDVENNGLKGLESLKPIETDQMCASGKDRTAWAMFLQSAKAACGHIKKSGANISLEQISAVMVKAGHSAQQAGGSFSLGSAIGCFGTRFDNAWGMGMAGVALVRGAILPLVTKGLNALINVPAQVLGSIVGVAIATGAKLLDSETSFKDIVKQTTKEFTVNLNSEFLRIGRSGLEKVAVALVEFSSHGTRDHLHLKPYKGDYADSQTYKEACATYAKAKNENELKKGDLKVTGVDDKGKATVEYIKKPSKEERSSEREEDVKKCTRYDTVKGNYDAAKDNVAQGQSGITMITKTCAKDGTEKPEGRSWKSFIPFTEDWKAETSEVKEGRAEQVSKYRRAIHGDSVTDGGQLKGEPASVEVQKGQKKEFDAVFNALENRVSQKAVDAQEVIVGQKVAVAAVIGNSSLASVTAVGIVEGVKEELSVVRGNLVAAAEIMREGVSTGLDHSMAATNAVIAVAPAVVESVAAQTEVAVAPAAVENAAVREGGQAAVSNQKVAQDEAMKVMQEVSRDSMAQIAGATDGEVGQGNATTIAADHEVEGGASR